MIEMCFRLQSDNEYNAPCPIELDLLIKIEAENNSSEPMQNMFNKEVGLFILEKVGVKINSDNIKEYSVKAK